MRPIRLSLLLGMLLAAPATHAQVPRTTQPPEELLAAFRRGADNNVSAVLLHHADYPAAYVETVLQGLEQLASTDSVDSRTRTRAILYLAAPGGRRSSRPMVGTFARLERLYRQSSNPRLRSDVVLAMGTLAVDRPAAVAFLERLAIQEVANADFPGSAGAAIGALTALEDEGRAALKRLHEAAAVRDPEARHQLSVLASLGYRAPRPK